MRSKRKLHYWYLIAAYRQGNKEKKMVAAQAVAVAANDSAEVARLSTFVADYPLDRDVR